MMIAAWWCGYCLQYGGRCGGMRHKENGTTATVFLRGVTSTSLCFVFLTSSAIVDRKAAECGAFGMREHSFCVVPRSFLHHRRGSTPPVKAIRLLLALFEGCASSRDGTDFMGRKVITCLVFVKKY